MAATKEQQPRFEGQLSGPGAAFRSAEPSPVTLCEEESVTWASGKSHMPRSSFDMPPSSGPEARGDTRRGEKGNPLPRKRDGVMADLAVYGRGRLGIGRSRHWSKTSGTQCESPQYIQARLAGHHWNAKFSLYPKSLAKWKLAHTQPDSA